MGTMKRLAANLPRGFGAAIGLIIAAVALVPIAWQLCGHWAEVGSYLARINVKGLLAAQMLAVLDLGILASAWLLIAGRLGIAVGIARHLKVFFVSNFTKRVPGLVWYVAARAYAYRTVDGGAWMATTGTLLENALLFLAGMLLALVLWPHQLGLHSSWIPASLLVSISIAVALSMYPAALVRLVRVFHVGKAAHAPKRGVVPLPARSVLSIIVLYTLVWLIGGVSLHCFVAAFDPSVSLAALPFTISVSIVYSLTGFVAFVVPAGLGVKELAGAYVLARLIPPPLAVAVMLLFRVNLLVAEGFWIVLSHCLERWSLRGMGKCTDNDVGGRNESL